MGVIYDEWLAGTIAGPSEHDDNRSASTRYDIGISARPCHPIPPGLPTTPDEEDTMKTLSTIVAATALAFAFAAPVPGFAQEVYFGPIIVMPDHSMSVKSMIGAPVYNDKHEKIGTIETVMVKPSAEQPMAVLSVGSYLGKGSRMVAVPLSHLQVEGKAAMMMAGATKAMLESMPIYAIAGG
jgi:hypothetical protein